MTERMGTFKLRWRGSLIRSLSQRVVVDAHAANGFRNAKCWSGWIHRIESFPLTINSHRIQELFSLMPGEDGKPASWDQETTTPYFYSVRLGDARILAEFSATKRCGYFRMTFPSGHAPAVVLANRLAGS